MAKNNPQPQGAFSFFDEIEKAEPPPKPQRNTLKPPAQIEAVEEAQLTEAITDKALEQPAPEITTSIAEQEHEITLHIDTQQKNEIPAETKPKEPEEIISLEKKSLRGRRSAKEHSLAAGMVQVPEDEALFQKQYYSMGEVAVMFHENHSLIRFWESEFDILKPKKNGKGDRFFRPEDVKNLKLIYDLLRRRKFTIEGAKEYLKNDKKAEEKFAAVQSLQKIKKFFLELKAGL